MYNALVKHMSSNNFGKTDFWTGSGQKQRKELYSKFVAAAKIRLQNHLKEPFQLPVQPLTLQGWFKIGDREPGDIIVDHQFAPHELAHYKELTENRAEFMNTCKTDRACQSLADLLALDHRYLTICDALASHDKQPFRETAPPAASSVLRDGNSDDDASGQGDDARKTPPTPPVAGKKRSQDDNFRTWLPTRPHSVAWNDLGFDDDEVPDRKNFVPACAFFFFIPDLPVKYPDANNALHRHWLTKFKAPMKADDFLEAPQSFDEYETDWFNANVELMTERLKEDERAVRGLSVTSAGRSRAVGTSRTQALANKNAASLAAEKAKAAEAALAVAARQAAKRANAGALPPLRTRARIQTRTARRALVGDKRSVPEDAEESSSETEAPHKPARYASKNMH